MNGMRLEPGVRIHDYELISVLGQGGMGRVYRARDTTLECEVALKLLLAEDANQEDRARFLREAKALARIEHPNVVRVRAMGEVNDLVWMAMDYIAGDPLDVLLGERPLDEETALLLGAQLARGLAAVHEVEVLHRDVKPSNCMIDADGRLHLIDFGVACFFSPPVDGGFQTQSGIAVGTPHYMSPEQARGDPLTATTDVWGLGCTLFSMLTGHPPFFETHDDQDMEILARILKDTIPTANDVVPGVSKATADYIAHLLDKNADHRPSSMMEISVQLEELCDQLANAMEEEEAQRKTIHTVPEGGSPVPTKESSVEETERVNRSPGSQTTQKAVSTIVSIGAAVVALTGLGVFLFLGFSLGSSKSSPEGLPVRGVSAQGSERPINHGRPSKGPLILKREERPRPSVVSSQQVRGKEENTERKFEETIDVLLAKIERQSPEQDDHIDRLLQHDTPDAAAAVALLLNNQRSARRILKRIEVLRNDHFLPQIQTLSSTAQRPVAFAIIDAVLNIRNVTSVRILEGMAQNHPDQRVRMAAERAKKKLFTVEPE